MKLSEAKIELLAPAGKWEVLETVVEAGANAVYLAGKQFNMRMHRSDFNFTNEQLAQAVEYAHNHKTKIYVTVNNLLSGKDIVNLRDYLKHLNEINVDAIIIQDLGVIDILRELDLDIAMHASTMMNVHSTEMANELKGLGISRIITSRDISISLVKEIGEKSGLEMEYFIHGDMCVSQSGQCYSSGVLFGKSANRGECMKPCRWKYSMVETKTGQSIGDLPEGYLLGIKDMFMFQHIPELVQSGICSFKIEGRMRHKDFLKHVVETYRKAIDDYLDSPFTYLTNVKDYEDLYSERVRDFTTSLAFSHATSNTFEYSGIREPLFLSRGSTEKRLTIDDLSSNPFEMANGNPVNKKKLAVKVSTIDAVRKSISAGADYVYLSGEISQSRGEMWTKKQLKEAVEYVHKAGKKIAWGTPRICMPRELSEVEWLFEKAVEFGVDGVLVQNLGALQYARRFGLNIISDFSFNSLNINSIKILKELNTSRITASLESSFNDLYLLAKNASLPVECIVHGPLPGMLLEHCLPAMLATKSNAKGTCRLPCRYINYALKDEKGEVRPIEVDQHCRNHIMFATDLCVLPYLNSFLMTNIEVLRIEAQYYEDDLVEEVVMMYRKRMDLLMDNPGVFYPLPEPEWQNLVDKSPRDFSLCAYIQEVTESKSTFQVMKAAI